MVNILFDASVIVNAKTAGKLHSTGLYRVSSEILKELSGRESFNILLFDVLYRERELNKYVVPHYPGCSAIKLHSRFFRNFLFSFGNAADLIRKKQERCNSKIAEIVLKFLKIAAISIYKNTKRFEKKFVINRNLSRRLETIHVYYSTYFPVPEAIIEMQDVLKVWTIHDLIPMVHPEYFSSLFNEKILRDVTENIQLRDVILCVSESTKTDLLFYRPDLNPININITPNAASDYFFPVKNQSSIELCKQRYGIDQARPYLLSLCTLEPRKNLKTLVKVYENLLAENKEFKYLLVLTGATGWETNELMMHIDEINNKFSDSIILTGFIPDEDLAPIYSGATAFIYPSLYEGFGLPVLEAMKCGIPVISSNSSSLPEVVVDAGILVEPLDQLALLNAIKTVIADSNKQAIMSKKSIERASYFNWTRTVNSIEQIIIQRIN